MSVTELEAQMMSAESDRHAQARLHHDRPPGPPKMSLSTTPNLGRCLVWEEVPLPAALASREPPRDAREVASFPPEAPPPARGLAEQLETLHHEEPGEGIPNAVAPAPAIIFPFTVKHREAILSDQSSESYVKPFLQTAGRQHAGLMTTSDKELIVRIQLNQMAAIGEQSQQKPYQPRRGLGPPDRELDGGTGDFPSAAQVPQELAPELLPPDPFPYADVPGAGLETGPDAASSQSGA
ncbi:unnamed protein product [Symbiodinium natans]|uniref:Uncharacterized protein n=1 Tax=Symbiodinium natans TaxID=878477 RepID=A0A812H519_9DINO|nr:unnamed protein product [Symbiodinium natans]